jgi:hypothetical protein
VKRVAQLRHYKHFPLILAGELLDILLVLVIVLVVCLCPRAQKIAHLLADM